MKLAPLTTNGIAAYLKEELPSDLAPTRFDFSEVCREVSGPGSTRVRNRKMKTIIVSEIPWCVMKRKSLGE